MILVLLALVLVAAAIGLGRNRGGQDGDRSRWPVALGIGVVAVFVLFGVRGAGGGGEDVVDAKVFFSQPLDSASVASPVQVVMEAEGLVIEPAGAVREGAGHFHVMVDAPCAEVGDTIPNDDAHRHFGKGQTETTLDLTPGEHTLCLQAGDGAHVAGTATDRITVAVAVGGSG